MTFAFLRCGTCQRKVGLRWWHRGLWGLLSSHMRKSPRCWYPSMEHLDYGVESMFTVGQRTFTVEEFMDYQEREDIYPLAEVPT